MTIRALSIFSIATFLSLHNLQANFKIEAAAGSFSPNANWTLARHVVEERKSKQVLEGQAKQDGSLSVDAELEAGIFKLAIENGPEFTLAPESDEIIRVVKKSDSFELQNSPGSNILESYEAFRKESLAKLVYPVREEIKAAKQDNADESVIAELTQKEVDAYTEHVHELNDFVIENANTTMALYGTSLRWNADYRTDELEELVKGFSDRHGQISASHSLSEKIETFKRTAVGSEAPRLTGKNLEGETEDLLDFRGQYVLIDFWASWCPPCRIENKHYKDLIDRIPQNQFTIFAVNLDTSDRLWSQAVKRDRATWTHISDLEGWTSELADLYGVNALPASFLLDPEGRIVAKNLRGEELETSLKELGIL